jgi:flagellar motor protein MotB
MVIFVLLLLVFLHRTAAKNPAVTDALLKTLREEMVPHGFSARDIQLDKKDRNAILVVVPDRLMNFEINKYTLRPEGEEFIRTRIPVLAEVLCGTTYRDTVEAVVVEGHTDATPYSGVSAEESQNLNLKLSQDRSMEVVKKSLSYLTDRPAHRVCFLEKLSASGRGEQDLEATADESRRVVFKIRVRADRAETLKAQVR